jgi:hypothetical protein
MRSALAISVVCLGVLVAFMAVAPQAAVAQQSGPKVIKGGKLDEIKLHVATLPSGPEIPVMVRRFSSEDADLGTGGQGGKQARTEEAAKIQKEGPEMLAAEFVARLTKLGFYTKVSVIDASASVPPEAIVVEGKFLKIDPGSRAARYFVGFGAGKSTVQVEGIVKDGTGKTLAEFSQRRFGAMGVGGGDSLEKLTSDAKSIGKDIAEFLDAWARGKSLK